MALDPRSVANLILEEAARRQKGITNLSLQKILYFVHGRFLIEEGRPLVMGSFEAWKFGPVSLPVYDAFKVFGSLEITGFAERKDIRSGVISRVELPSDEYTRQRIIDFCVPYLSLSAGRLVELSHAKGSPWDRVTANKSGTRIYGLRMSNECITEFFRYHKVSVGTEPKVGEPHEESPPDRN